MSQVKRVFEPKSRDECLRGWLLHAHKSRDRQDEAARRLDFHRYLIGVPATALAALAGTSTLATWQEETANEAISLLAGIVAIMAAVLVGLQTFLNYGARAEQHRVAGARYKAVIREIERSVGSGLCPQISEDLLANEKSSHSHQTDEDRQPVAGTIPSPAMQQHKAATGGMGKTLGAEDCMRELQNTLDRLEEEAPVVPIHIFNRVEKRYEGVRFVETAEELNSAHCVLSNRS